MRKIISVIKPKCKSKSINYQRRKYKLPHFIDEVPPLGNVLNFQLKFGKSLSYLYHIISNMPLVFNRLHMKFHLKK